VNPSAPASVATLAPLSPALRFDPELLLAAQGIKVAFFDVDGVLTDGGLYFSESGETLKRFSTLDGHGLKLLPRAGITPVVITGRDSQPLRRRLQALGITHVHYGTEDKRPAAEQTLQALGWTGRRPPPSATIGPTCPCCADAPLPPRRPTPTPKPWPAPVMSPDCAGAKVPGVSSATCCWWPAAATRACCRTPPHEHSDPATAQAGLESVASAP